LNLQNCSITDVGIGDVTKVATLKNLNLQGNAMTDTHVLNNLTELTCVDLSNCFLMDEEFRFVGNLTNLTELRLSYCRITDATPSERKYTSM
jgi:Leucine-rich repeat (LRR) protein